VRILGGELPINANLFDIAPPRPGSCLTAECFQILDAPVQALPGEQAQFNFGDVQSNRRASAGGKALLSAGIRYSAGRSCHGYLGWLTTRSLPRTTCCHGRSVHGLLNPFTLVVTQIQANHFYSLKTADLRIVYQLKYQHNLVPVDI